MTEKFVPEIRLLKTQEIDAAVDLFTRQLREHQLSTDLSHVRSLIEQIIKNSRLGFVLVAVANNGGPVGVALGCAFLGIEHRGKSGWLEELYILPEFRKRGIGSLLIAEFIRIALGLGCERLTWKLTPVIGRRLPCTSDTVSSDLIARALAEPLNSSGEKNI